MDGGLGGGSFTIARVWGIAIKIHIFFVVWMGFGLMTAAGKPGGLQTELIFNGLLFGSVLLHELGHCAGARYMGGSANEVILWPLGGLAMIQVPRKASAEFISTAAGPAVNLVLFVIGAVVVGTDLFLRQADPSAQAAQQVIPFGTELAYQLAYINAGLFVFNVLPAYPMDGGRLFRSMLWPLLGWRTATLIATSLAILFGVAFAGFGLVGRDPPNMLLALIGVMVVMASMKELQAARDSGKAPVVAAQRWAQDDFGPGSWREPPPGPPR